MSSSTTPSKQDVLVPETLLKKRKSTEKSREEKKAAALDARKARKAKRAVIFKRAEQYVNDYKKKEREEIRLKRPPLHQNDRVTAHTESKAPTTSPTPPSPPPV